MKIRRTSARFLRARARAMMIPARKFFSPFLPQKFPTIRHGKVDIVDHFSAVHFSQPVKGFAFVESET